MKTEVTLLVRGRRCVREVNAPNPSSAGAIAMLHLPPYLDRMRDIKVLQCVGYCGFKAPHLDLTRGRNCPPSHS